MIFVFGSNLAGRHGKGAAAYARMYHGAEPGNGVGPQGNSYAIPTKDRRIVPMHIRDIEVHVEQFTKYAKANRGLLFALTPIGCGLAGHAPHVILNLFHKHGLPNNVYLHPSWVTDGHLLPED